MRRHYKSYRERQVDRIASISAIIFAVSACCLDSEGAAWTIAFLLMIIHGAILAVYMVQNREKLDRELNNR